MRNKVGDGIHKRDALRAVELKGQGKCVVFMKSKPATQHLLRKKLRNHVHYVLNKVRKQNTLKLDGGSGVVLHCRDKDDWEANRANMTKAVCYDLAKDESHPDAYRGVAAVRWFEESGHVLGSSGQLQKPRIGRPKHSQAGDPNVIKNQQVFGTWNGKFGVTCIASLPPKGTPIPTLESIVQGYPSVKRAWSEVKDFSFL